MLATAYQPIDGVALAGGIHQREQTLQEFHLVLAFWRSGKNSCRATQPIPARHLAVVSSPTQLQSTICPKGSGQKADTWSQNSSTRQSESLRLRRSNKQCASKNQNKYIFPTQKKLTTNSSNNKAGCGITTTILSPSREPTEKVTR